MQLSTNSRFIYIYSKWRKSKLYYELNWKTLKVKARRHSLLLRTKRKLNVYCLIMLQSCDVKHGHKHSDGLSLTKQESRKWQTSPLSYRDKILNSRVTQWLWVAKKLYFHFRNRHKNTCTPSKNIYIQEPCWTMLLYRVRNFGNLLE
jgi:hypothetical protein